MKRDSLNRTLLELKQFKQATKGARFNSQSNLIGIETVMRNPKERPGFSSQSNLIGIETEQYELIVRQDIFLSIEPYWN